MRSNASLDSSEFLAQEFWSWFCKLSLFDIPNRWSNLVLDSYNTKPNRATYALRVSSRVPNLPFSSLFFLKKEKKHSLIVSYSSFPSFNNWQIDFSYYTWKYTRFRVSSPPFFPSPSSSRYVSPRLLPCSAPSLPCWNPSCMSPWVPSSGSKRSPMKHIAAMISQEQTSAAAFFPARFRPLRCIPDAS